MDDIFGPNKTIERQNKRSSLFNPSPDFIDSNRLELDISYIVNPPSDRLFISELELEDIAPAVLEKLRMLKKREGNCRDGDVPMLGWMTFPDSISKEHLDKIDSTAKELSGKIDAFVSLGIGGSYLGIEATFKALSHTFFNQLTPEERRGTPEVYFLGQNTDPDFFRDTLDMLKDKRIGINVISKSGTTAETAIAFRIMRGLLEKLEGDNAAELIIATTDKSRGALRKLATDKGYRTFVVPDDVG